MGKVAANPTKIQARERGKWQGTGPSLEERKSRLCAQPANLLKFFHEGAVVSNVLPEAFEDGADVVADGKLVIELAGGSSMFHI